MNADVMLTLCVVSLLTLFTVALAMAWVRAKAELDAMALKLSDFGQELVKFDAELGAVAREGYELNARFENHLMDSKPVRKPAAKKAPAKKAAPKKATPAKKAPRQRSVS